MDDIYAGFLNMRAVGAYDDNDRRASNLAKAIPPTADKMASAAVAASRKGPSPSSPSQMGVVGSTSPREDPETCSFSFGSMLVGLVGMQEDTPHGQEAPESSPQNQASGTGKKRSASVAGAGAAGAGASGGRGMGGGRGRGRGRGGR